MSLLMLATKTASVKRASIVGGKRGEPVTVLSDLPCTPLYPADPDMVNNLLQRLNISTPYRMLETFVPGNHEIHTGDMLIVDGESYQVRAVADWKPGRPTTRAFTHLTIEEIPSS
jgi:hypothetical protein